VNDDDAGGDLDHTLSGIRSSLRSALRNLREVELSPNELNVLEELLKGRRTIPELVLLMYGKGIEDAEYRTYYMRVRRAVARLESKGMISTRLFGKKKPYKLSRHAIERLLAIGEGNERRVAPRLDYVVYGLTLALCLATLSVSRHVYYPAVVLGLAGGSLVFVGISLCRVLETIRRVM